MYAVAQFIECKIQQEIREQESYSENKPLRHEHNTQHFQGMLQFHQCIKT